MHGKIFKNPIAIFLFVVDGLLMGMEVVDIKTYLSVLSVRCWFWTSDWVKLKKKKKAILP